ncbi:extracellular solute-binding protein [Paenibacillus eucommiae]|uniref:ABC-type glycerol-3-phosphate transport system substrate-binding protein n=1 Tax=Paenibacillus eucommiae TaxID=1355755 RepID=A0ABS4IRF0_9BACL|nr:extracellular solute-binding protein [Paenibacillus eucommiae]MBP1989471.1 ABC-type glycerol-3-phosphate transport system substrate-binding protein [Paenibacillus eucommiae]
MIKKGACLLAACLLTVTLYGCTSKEKDNTTSGPTSTDAAKKIEKVYTYANAGNLTLASTLSKAEDLELVKQFIMDNSGFEVVPIIPPKGQVPEKLNLLLASNEPLDIFLGDVNTFRDHGAIQPLNELLNQYGDHIKKLWPKEWDSSWKALTDTEGKIWGIPIVPALAEKAVFLRSDWMKKLNLEMPKTIDEFENVLKEFQEKDPAGSGQTIPMITNLEGLNLALAAGYMDTGYGDWLDQDGKIKPAELHPGYKEFIAKMADWYQKGYIYKETFTINAEKMRELIKQNRVASNVIHYSVVTNILDSLQQNVPEAMYEVPDELQGPKGNITTMPDLPTIGWFVNKKSKNPEAAIKLLDWVHSDINNYLSIFYGIKDKHWRYTDEKNHVFERLNQDYVGEFLTGSTFAYTVQFAPSDPASKPEFDFLGKYSGDTSRVKKAFTLDAAYRYDQKEITEKLPNKADIKRMIGEEVTKFIMGARPISDYDKFIQELYTAGLDKWIEVYTDQYHKAVGSQ